MSQIFYEREVVIRVNSRFLTQNITGVQRFAIEISKQLKKLCGDNIEFVAPANIVHTELAKELGVTIVGDKTGHLWEQVDLPKYLRQNSNPLLLNLANTAPMFYANKIVTLHDIAFERFPQTFSWKFRLFYKILIPQIVKNSKHIITVSEFSKNEISELYGIQKENISVAYNSTSDVFWENKIESLDRYVLAVSSLNYQKNFHALVKAFNETKNQNIKLYLVGSINKNFASVNLIDDIEKNSNIVSMGRVSDTELIKLYSNAICFVYPSLYEGFGIPPLEAQACGCPVVASNAASLPEVCMDSVLYCNPNSIEDITEKILAVLSDENLQNSLRVKGFENIKRFSWHKSAEKILNIIKEKGRS